MFNRWFHLVPPRFHLWWSRFRLARPEIDANHLRSFFTLLSGLGATLKNLTELEYQVLRVWPRRFHLLGHFGPILPYAFPAVSLCRLGDRSDSLRPYSDRLMTSYNLPDRHYARRRRRHLKCVPKGLWRWNPVGRVLIPIARVRLWGNRVGTSLKQVYKVFPTCTGIPGGRARLSKGPIRGNRGGTRGNHLGKCENDRDIFRKCFADVKYTF